MPLPSEGWIAPRYGAIVPAIAGAVPEPITGTYRDFAGTAPTHSLADLSRVVVQQGGQEATAVDGLDIADARTVEVTLALNEVYGAVLLDRVRVPSSLEAVPIGGAEDRPASVFNACEDRPVTIINECVDA